MVWKEFLATPFLLQFPLVCAFPLTGGYCRRPYGQVKDWAGENDKREYFSFCREAVIGIKPPSRARTGHVNYQQQQKTYKLWHCQIFPGGIESWRYYWNPLKSWIHTVVVPSSKLGSLLWPVQWLLWLWCELARFAWKGWQYSLGHNVSVVAGWHGGGRIVKWKECDLRVRCIYFDFLPCQSR